MHFASLSRSYRSYLQTRCAFPTAVCVLPCIIYAPCAHLDEPPLLRQPCCGSALLPRWAFSHINLLLAASRPSQRTHTRSRATTAPVAVPVPAYSCLSALQARTGRRSLSPAHVRPLSPHRQALQQRRLLLPASPTCSSLPCCVPLFLACPHTQGATGRGRSTSALQDVRPRRPWLAVASR